MSAVIVVAMADGERIASKLDLDPHADPIRGLLTPTDGAGQEFVGWHGLAGAIERLLSSADMPASAPDRSPR